MVIFHKDYKLRFVWYHLPMRYFVTDTETGGLTKDFSLLTLYGAILNEDFEIIDEIELKIKPGHRKYVLLPEAMEINKIDIVAHDKEAKLESICADQLKTFLKKHIMLNNNEKLVLGGHNVYFDVMFIEEHLLFDFNDLFSRHRLDTGTLGLLLKLIGKFPQDEKISLENLAKCFGIKFENFAHDARSDTKVTIEVLKCTLEALKTQKIEQNQQLDPILVQKEESLSQIQTKEQT